MLRYAIRRLINMVVVLFVVSLVTFAIFYVIPNGDPADRMAGKVATPAQVEQIRKDFGFNDSLPQQYVRLMEKMFDGSLVSYSNQTNVREELIRGLPVTLSLVLGASVVWLLGGVLLGTLSALYAGRWPDKAITVFAMLGISLPVFWIGALALYYLTFKVQLFPPGGYVPLSEDPASWFSHLILPWTVLSVLFIGFYSRILRSNMLDAMDEDHVRTARAKGIAEEQVVRKHILRNSLIPLVTIFGLDFAAAFGGGAIITESIFDLQGIGQYTADAVGGLDLPPIMALTLYGAFFIVFFSAVIDIVYAKLDPRVRLET